MFPLFSGKSLHDHIFRTLILESQRSEGLKAKKGKEKKGVKEKEKRKMKDKITGCNEKSGFESG